MTKDINKYNPSRIGDYIVYCDTCGSPWWKSQCTLLKNETGLGGSFVCPRDKDVIDYGLVPYKIRAERSIPIARINNFNDTSVSQTYSPITNFNTTNVMNWPLTNSERDPRRFWDLSTEIWNTSNQTWDNT